MNVLLANLIKCIHILLIVFLVLAPFTKDSLIICLNLIVMTGIMIHWSLNNQVCCLTEFEKLCRGKECDSETFFGQLVGPVYTLNQQNQIAWIVILFLFAFNLKKFYDYRHDFSNKIKIIFKKNGGDNSNTSG
jgi:hypothetical protein